MNWNHKLVFIGVLGIALVSASCSSNTASLQAGLNPAGEAQVAAHRLGDQLQVQQLAGDNFGGIYRAKVVLLNLKNKQQDLQYQFSWYDSAGSEVGLDRDAWTPLIVYGKDQKTIMAMAPSQAVSSFRISIRDLKADKTFKTNFLSKR